jgi:hypothetical protein
MRLRFLKSGETRTKEPPKRCLLTGFCPFAPPDARCKEKPVFMRVPAHFAGLSGSFTAIPKSLKIHDLRKYKVLSSLIFLAAYKFRGAPVFLSHAKILLTPHYPFAVSEDAESMLCVDKPRRLQDSRPYLVRLSAYTSSPTSPSVFG